MKELYWKIRIFFLALRWIPQINIGDTIYYNGKKYIVRNRVRYDSWRLSKLINLNNGWVKRTKCKKVWTLENIKRSFKSGYSFYTVARFDIWCDVGIKD